MKDKSDLRVTLTPTGRGYTLRLVRDGVVLHRTTGIPTEDEARRRATAIRKLYGPIPVRTLKGNAS